MRKEVMLIIIIVIISGCKATDEKYVQEIRQDDAQSEITEPVVEIVEKTAEASGETFEEKGAPKDEPAAKTPEWIYGGLAIEGNYADSDFVDLGNGKYRMYYGIEPEVPGNKLEVYSAISSDGINWEQESGVRRTFTVFPDVVRLPDGRWRIYFQNMGVIKSAVSSDGLSWEDESGTRIDTKNNEGLAFENVAGPTTVFDGNRYIMAYSGAMNQRYEGDVPNDRMAVLMWATSDDGLKFEVQGMALDSRNDKFLGWVDTPDLVRWDDGSIKLFFWGYFGIYESAFTGDGFTEPKLVYAAKKEDPLMVFPSNPPGDPNLGKVGDKWFMYYSQHTKGIYYATLE